MLIFVFRWLTYRRYLVTQQAADLHDMRSRLRIYAICAAGYGTTRYHFNDTKKPNPQFLRIRGWVINGWRTDLVSHKATLQYLQRWNVSRPGSGWDGVGPLRFVHANGSECEIALCIHNRHALDLPSGKPSAMRTRRLHMSPCVQLEPLIPVIFWGPYLTNSVSTLILGGISHLDAFSGSYVQT